MVINDAAQERDGYLEKIARLETLIETQKEELNDKINILATLQSNLRDMTTAKNDLLEERNEQIEKLATYQELVLEKESASAKRWNERINSLESSLAEAEESLLVSQSTLKTYVLSLLDLPFSYFFQEVQEVKSEYEKKKLQEEINALTRMREKAEMKLEVEVQKSQLSERLRKEATEESQQLTQKCHQLEDDLDLVQKQYCLSITPSCHTYSGSKI